MATQVALLATHRARRLRPGARVEWEDDTGETRVGIVADDEGTTTDLRIGAPGAPAQHLVPVLPCEPIYVDAATLHLI